MWPEIVVVQHEAVKVCLAAFPALHSSQRLIPVSKGALQPFRQVVIDFSPDALADNVLDRVGGKGSLDRRLVRTEAVSLNVLWRICRPFPSQR